MVKLDINKFLYIGILIIIVLLICLKSISIQDKIHESFDGHVMPPGMTEPPLTVGGTTTEETSDVDAANNTASEVDNSTEDGDEKCDSSGVNAMSNQERQDLMEKCTALSGEGIWGSVISKYSGKVVNVENVSNQNGIKKYIIKWQPLGGKPGGCITFEANGTFSTPLCNANINKQLWFINHITCASDFKKRIPENRRSMGRPLEETSYPFYIIQSSEDERYVLNYEGGGLSIRMIANYDGIKWDVSKDKVQQDPIPTQGNHKFTSLTPGHNMSATDKSLNSVFNNSLNSKGGQGGQGSSGDGATNLNFNLDPDLLARLGLILSGGSVEDLNKSLNNSDLNASIQKSNQQNGSNVPDDLLIPGKEGNNSTGGRGDTNEMFQTGTHNENCKDCNKIPENYIKKDLVKSMCLGCDNIDNVKT